MLDTEYWIEHLLSGVAGEEQTTGTQKYGMSSSGGVFYHDARGVIHRFGLYRVCGDTFGWDRGCSGILEI